MFISSEFDQVWVSTDNDEIAAESLKSGSLVFKRSSEFATDDAPSISAVQEFIASNRGKTPAILIKLIIYEFCLFTHVKCVFIYSFKI